MNENFDVIILGGGASGLAAAAALSGNKNLKTAVIEKEDKLGRRLLATGNGRCNLTNLDMSELHYNHSARPFMRGMLVRTTPERLMKTFGRFGLLCRADSAGRVYPYANQSSAVLDSLMLWINDSHIDVRCGVNVDTIEARDQGFVLHSTDDTYKSKTLILATGGAVQKSLGADGSSYRFAEQLSLECTPVFPSLAPVIVSDKDLNIAKGVRVAADVSIEADGETLKTESGELQLNEKNISGICVFQLSRLVNEFFALGTVNGKKRGRIIISADMAPDYTPDELFSLLSLRTKALPDAPADELFTGMINKKLGLYLMKKRGVQPKGRVLSSLSDGELHALAKSIKRCEFTPGAASSVSAAQVTAGGISLDEIDRNFRSVKHRGLYIVGEALDIDGDCGGYNLHAAFAGGFSVGFHAGKSLRSH